MALKWQDIAKYGGTGLVSVFVLLGLVLNLSGISFSDDGDKVCNDCYSEIEINSTYWQVCVENSGDKDIAYKKSTYSQTLWINLDKVNLVTTNPQADTEILVPTTKSLSTINHPEYGYLRPVKSGDCIIKRNTKSNPNPSRIIIHGIDVRDRVKWTFDYDTLISQRVLIDPVWDGINVTKICDTGWRPVPVYQDFTYSYTCPTSYVKVNTTLKYAWCYERKWYEPNLTYIFTLIFEHKFDYGYLANKTVYWITTNQTGTTKEEYCKKITGVKIGRYRINFTECDIACIRYGNSIVCDSCRDGNCDGILQSGESGFKLDIINPDWKKLNKRIDSFKFINLRECVVKDE